MNDKQILGSLTAKNGFANEDDIVDKFNNWQNDETAKNWLIIMQYNISDIEYVKAVKLSGKLILNMLAAVHCSKLQIFDKVLGQKDCTNKRKTQRT